ncbi:hydroxyethylthiazole kinase [Nocardioides sp. TRM66260-LWL]|uniref:hydroxyethylthiazole kinase n=1 Tax=Nocardioides sp. TRM66260-LWL TaxID=2874478 RepID=UPI001CC57A60|nr:hydroxyethylthiazole kinase [Nocardioides sp. TRM66260-LWL]MBZ5733115.1 hydroxyethylthiazole kinase [Nocardioides sp. TRM66260-LWL]
MADAALTIDALAARIATVHAALRERAPLTQCLTNYVSMDLAANLLTAAGASPAMVHDEREAGELAGLADAVVVNIGTLSPPWVAGMRAAAQVAVERGRPWVLDPVAVGATAYRRATAAELIGLRPTVIRGNASEIRALAGGGPGGRGVDATEESVAVVDDAVALARSSGAVVVVSGATDVVTDGARVVLLTGGDARMPLVSALGCASSALVGACAGVADDPLIGAAAAMTVLAVAGRRAGRLAAGPGTLRAHLLDELAALDSLDPQALRLDGPSIEVRGADA